MVSFDRSEYFKFRHLGERAIIRSPLRYNVCLISSHIEVTVALSATNSKLLEIILRRVVTTLQQAS